MKSQWQNMILSAALLLIAFLPGHVLAKSGQKPEDPKTPDAVAYTLMETFWSDYTEILPSIANGMGEFIHMDRIDDLSEEGFQKQRDLFDKAIADLADIDRERLSDENKMNYDYFAYMLATERKNLDLPSRFFRLTTVYSWQTLAMAQTIGTPLKSSEDYENYITRLSKFQQLAKYNIELLRQGIETGYVQPCNTLSGYEQVIVQAIKDEPTESFAFKVVENIPLRLGKDFAEDIQERTKALIRDLVNPALRDYLDFYNNEYLPACRKNAGLVSLDGGYEVYATLVKNNTSDPDVTPEEIHQLGLSEVARIRSRMDEIIKDLDFDGDFKDFQKFMRTNEAFYPKTPEEYMNSIAGFAKKIDRQIPRYFAYMPRNRFTLEPVPMEQAPTTAMAFYFPGSSEAGIAGMFFVNLYALHERSLNTVPALTLHEADPGHHFQISIQQELKGLPTFRKGYSTTAFVEGWGLYTEYLGEEMGAYETPYELFARLDLEMWRANRLVVDTGMHAKGWTRQQAIDYMVKNTSLSLQNITAEVNRYITFPGQAVSYKFGEIKIRQVRAWAEKTLGGKFSLRDFHAHLLLGGSLPMSVMERRMKDWVQSQL